MQVPRIRWRIENMDLHCVVRAAVSTEAQSLPIWNHRSLEFFGRWLGHHFRDQLLSPVIVEGHGVARNMDGTGFKKTQFTIHLESESCDLRIDGFRRQGFWSRTSCVLEMSWKMTSCSTLVCGKMVLKNSCVAWWAFKGKRKFLIIFVQLAMCKNNFGFLQGCWVLSLPWSTVPSCFSSRTFLDHINHILSMIFT